MNKKGFTLIELLVVIAILGILAGFVTVNVLKVYDRQKGKISRQEQKVIKQGVENILTMLEDCEGDFDKDLEFVKSLGYKNCTEARSAINSSSGETISLSTLKSSGYINGSNFDNYVGSVSVTRENGKYDIDVSNIISKDNIKVANLDKTKLKNFITSNSNVTEIIFDYGKTSNNTNEISVDNSDGKIYAYIEGTTLYVRSEGQIYAPIDSSLMFHSRKQLKKITFNNFDTSNVKKTSQMFYQCINLNTIYVSDSFNLDDVDESNSTSMFNSDTNLVGGSGTMFNEHNPVDKTYARIDDPDNNKPGYFTAK